jgi:NhaP-type Na+/H+ or K+/H+ antiporter
MGSVLAAVSPAVVVPRMVALMEEGRGTAKKIPQLILAGASLDDIIVIVLFTAFLGINTGHDVGVMTFLNIPISIVLGIILGAAVGLAAAHLFELFHRKGHTIRNIFPRQRCRPPSEPFRFPWDCRAETSFCRSPFSASLSPHRLARS